MRYCYRGMWIVLLILETILLFRSPDGNNDLFEIITGVLQRDTFHVFLYISWNDSWSNENSLSLKKRPEAADIPQKLW